MLLQRPLMPSRGFWLGDRRESQIDSVIHLSGVLHNGPSRGPVPWPKPAMIGLRRSWRSLCLILS